MKDVVKYVASILAFIGVGFGLSWSAVYSFWFSALIFRSVPAVRACDAVAFVILTPVRVLFWLMSDVFNQSAPLLNPLYYATVNAVLLGLIGYACCRRWLFTTKPRAASATRMQSGSPR